MKWFEVLVLIVLFLFLFIGSYTLWLLLPQQTLSFEAYHANISNEFPINSYQFYANMRYPDKTITYSLAESCSDVKKRDFRRATEKLEKLTVLDFKEATSGQIEITCSRVAPKATNEDHFIAGEGGPTEIINSTIYAIITSGQISLYRKEECDTPQVAVHEILHALGFNHNSNKESIMYPVTECEQTVDANIINSINSLYKAPSKGDLVIENIRANKTGKYLNFRAVITNQGLKKITNSSLKLIVDNKIINEYVIGELDLGTKKSLETTNIVIPRDTQEITLIIETEDEEILKTNNKAKINIISPRVKQFQQNPVLTKFK